MRKLFLLLFVLGTLALGSHAPLVAPLVAQTTFTTPLNNATSFLAAAYTAGSGSITLRTGDGPLFGSPSSSAPVRITVVSRATLVNGQIAPTSTRTIFTCTGRTGDTLTGLAVAEGTSDHNYAVNDPIAALVTAGTISEIQTGVNARVQTTTTQGGTPGNPAAATLVQFNCANNTQDLAPYRVHIDNGNVNGDNNSSLLIGYNCSNSNNPLIPGQPQINTRWWGLVREDAAHLKTEWQVEYFTGNGRPAVAPFKAVAAAVTNGVPDTVGILDTTISHGYGVNDRISFRDGSWQTEYALMGMNVIGNGPGTTFLYPLEVESAAGTNQIQSYDTTTGSSIVLRADDTQGTLVSYLKPLVFGVNLGDNNPLQAAIQTTGQLTVGTTTLGSVGAQLEVKGNSSAALALYTSAGALTEKVDAAGNHVFASATPQLQWVNGNTCIGFDGANFFDIISNSTGASGGIKLLDSANANATRWSVSAVDGTQSSGPLAVTGTLSASGYSKLGTGPGSGIGPTGLDVSYGAGTYLASVGTGFPVVEAICTDAGGATTKVQSGSAAGYVGTESNHPVHFRVNNVTQAVLDATGALTCQGNVAAGTGKALQVGSNSITFAAAAPTGGGIQGDVCWNTAVASGQPEGWRCVAAGTWSAMANHP